MRKIQAENSYNWRQEQRLTLSPYVHLVFYLGMSNRYEICGVHALALMAVRRSFAFFLAECERCVGMVVGDGVIGTAVTGSDQRQPCLPVFFLFSCDIGAGLVAKQRSF
ncbi:MAG: hypothetical protein R3E31_19190 [Chloroflexota bacterium]